ncbi:MAG: IS91 family transposase [Chloroflexi bacterium]|nr:IS91 family transposase [Chloroflexota bacterium]
MTSAHEQSYIHVRGQTTAYEVADVFRDYGDAYRAQYPVTPEQARVMGAIVACRTAVLGGQIYECINCGAVEFAYHSCRDRHYPKCQKFARAQWVEAQKVYLLPIPYFHVVFTTDHAINAWVGANRAVIYNLLFAVASAVLQAFAARELGGELGITVVLHTWGQTLLQHIHVHCIVTGGALSFDGRRWVRCAPNYLFDIVAVSAAFREAFCAGLVRLAEGGKLVGVEAAEVKATVAEIQAKKWEVFAKPFEKPEAVIEYLSRYVHAVAISNYRLTHIGGGQARFRYYDNPDGGKQKEMTLPAVEFIRRFLLHVLPERFVRVRYYGLHHSAARKSKLPRARALLGMPPALPKVTKLVLAVWLETVLGEDLHRCHWCGERGTMAYRGEVGDMPRLWLWLKVLFGWLFGASLRADVAAA